jgi:hypothetical protein
VLAPLGLGIARVVRGIGAGFAWVYARVLTPVGHALIRLSKGVGYVLAAVGAGVFAAAAWLVRCLVVVPAGWLYRCVLAPAGHAVAWLADGLVRFVRVVLTGVGTCLYWILRLLLVLPALALWRWILTPVGRVLAVVGRETAAALGHAWRVAGHVSLVVGRFLGTLFRWIFRWIFVEPVRWAYRTVLTPVGHVLRDIVLRPAAEAARSVGRATRQALAAARETARQARADFRRMLFGEPRGTRAVSPPETAREPVREPVREPMGRETRTLGSSTTALTKD